LNKDTKNRRNQIFGRNVVAKAFLRTVNRKYKMQLKEGIKI
jgi:hypothetical protein